MLNEVLRLTKGEIKTKATIKIYECIFCNSSSVEAIAKTKNLNKIQNQNWFVRCNNCFAQGAVAGSQNDAIAYWNREPQYLEKNLTPNIFEQD